MSLHIRALRSIYDCTMKVSRSLMYLPSSVVGSTVRIFCSASDSEQHSCLKPSSASYSVRVTLPVSLVTVQAYA